MRAPRHPIYNVQTYRDWGLSYLLIIVLGVLYTMGKFFPPLLPTAILIGLFVLLARRVPGAEDLLSALDCWRCVFIFLLWLVYGALYRDPGSLVWPAMVGSVVGTASAVVNLATFFRMHASHETQYEWLAYVELFLLAFYPAQHTVPSLAHPRDFFVRALVFFTAWTLNDLRIRQTRPKDVYADVDAVLLPLQTVWILFAWMPVVYALAPPLCLVLAFFVVRDSTRERKRETFP